MEKTFPSDAELAVLARQVDDQLDALRSRLAPPGQFRGGAASERAELPVAPE